MSHIHTDRLAALADEMPTPDEATHLAGCYDCKAEVAAFRRLARLALAAPAVGEPLTAWSQLGPQLRAAGLITEGAAAIPGGATVVPFAPRTAGVPRWVLRAAAAVALLVGGAAVGRVTSPAAGAFGGALGGTPAVTAAIPVGAFESNDQAMRVLGVAQQQYQSAAAYLASQDTSSRFIGLNQDTYRTRLAALDEIAAAARAALYRAPQDPLLNQYYLTTLGAREATLRQIGASLPPTGRLERY